MESALIIYIAYDKEKAPPMFPVYSAICSAS